PNLDGADNFATSSTDTTLGGGVMLCPNHPEGKRSYTMNRYASAHMDYEPSTNTHAKPTNSFGQQFRQFVDYGSSMLLISEAWAKQDRENLRTGEIGFFTLATIGQWGLPGEKFGAGNGVSDQALNAPGGGALGGGIIAPEWAGATKATAWVPYYRHPRRTTNTVDIEGGVNIGKVDGSVEIHKANELIDTATEKSTYKVLWSPIDRQLERD
ncbi:MAG: hypothetical protein AAGK04_10860, partial [Planctomycetota bacterium]